MNELVEATLKYVNQQRVLNGGETISELRKGFLRSACSCPISSSIRDVIRCSVAPGSKVFSNLQQDRNWHISFYTDLDETVKEEILPTEVAEFARKFDDGEFPEYALEEDDSN